MRSPLDSGIRLLRAIQRRRSHIASPTQWALEVSRCLGSQCGRVLQTGICALEHFGPRLPVMLFLYSVADEPANPGEACGQREQRR